MKKKIIIIIVAIVASLAVIGSGIGIYFALIHNDNNIHISELNITNSNISAQYDYNGVNTKLVTLDEFTITYRINYQILPDNATNKKIIFTSSNSEIATVSTNGFVVFVKLQDVIITLTTQDESNLSRAIHFQFSPLVSSSLFVTVEAESVNFSTEEENPLYESEETTLALIEGVEYIITTTAVTTLQNTRSTFLQGKLRPYGLEDFDITFSEGGISHTIHVVVLPFIEEFSLGLNYSSYVEIMEDFSGEQTSDFYTKIYTPYEVGNANEFYFDIKILNQEQLVIKPEEVLLNYTVTDITDELNPFSISDITTIATINNNIFSFKPIAIDRIFIFEIEPKYNITKKSPCFFTIKINEGYNVWTHQQLKDAFSDLDINLINIHSNIIPILNESQITFEMEIRANNYYHLYEEETLGYEIFPEKSGSAYSRYVPLEYHGENLLILNGNFFNINGSNLPRLSYLENQGQFGEIPWTKENPNFHIAAAREAIFKVEDGRGELIDCENYLQVTYNNLKVIANSSKEIILPAYASQEDFIEEELNLMFAQQGSGHCAFMALNAQTNYINTVATKATTGYFNSEKNSIMQILGSITYDIWGQGVYALAPSKTILTNSKLTAIGGASICLNDTTYSLESTITEDDLFFMLNEGVVIENYSSGLERWFVVNGFNDFIEQFKTSIKGEVDLNEDKIPDFDYDEDGIIDLGIETVGKTISKYVDLEGNLYSRIDDYIGDPNDLTEVFNYIFQIISSYTIPEIDTDEDGIPDTLAPDCDIQFTLEILTNESEVLSAISANPEITFEELEAIRNHKLIERKTNFKNEHFLNQLNGQYLTAIGEYSNSEEKFLNSIRTCRVAYGYLSEDSIITNLLNETSVEIRDNILQSILTIYNTELDPDTTVDFLITNFALLDSLQQKNLIALIGNDEDLQEYVSNFITAIDDPVSITSMIIEGYLTEDASILNLFDNAVAEISNMALNKMLEIYNGIFEPNLTSVDDLRLEFNYTLDSIQQDYLIEQCINDLFLQATSEQLIFQTTHALNTAFEITLTLGKEGSKSMLEINPNINGLEIGVGDEIIFILEYFDLLV